MEWEVLFDEDFTAWFEDQEENLQDEIIAYVELLGQHGPNLARPRVDTIKGSKFPNMKELRIQWQGQPWRILFAFDPKRRSILLVGGNKRGDKRWYDKNIPVTDSRYERHLKNMEKHDGDKRKRLH